MGAKLCRAAELRSQQRRAQGGERATHSQPMFI